MSNLIESAFVTLHRTLRIRDLLSKLLSKLRRVLAILRCVERCWPSTRQAKRFGNAERLLNALDAGTAAGGAYQFPDAASFRISFSSIRSDTALRIRAFSASRSFSRLT